MFFDPFYFIIIAPAMLLAFVAQMWIKSAYAKASQIPARMSGYEAARTLMDRAGINGVEIEQVAGRLSDHYDPRAKVLRLSQDVFHGRSLAAVGIAAHEVGHAMQDDQRYLPLMIRNAAVPFANFGGSGGMTLTVIGMMLASYTRSGGGFAALLMYAGIALFSATVFFQLINLPVEFNASSRAKRQLVHDGIVTEEEMPFIRKVLSAAALTYVAATLQAILTLAYLLLRASSRRR